jgi:NADPH-dependent ferric siderophore reductase
VGSQFIDGLKSGDEIYMSSPRGKRLYEPGVKKQFIFGDETSLGLACSFQNSLISNQHQFEFYFELDDENRKAPQLLGLENFRVFPKNGSFSNEKWIGDLPVVKTADWQGANFILTGNVNAVQAFRKVLKKAECGKVFSQGYWLKGKKGL